jgi:regulator of sigma E protease
VHTLLYIIEIVVAIGLIIFVHELGHFLAAKRFGVRVRKFALGMGPPIVRWTHGETEYSLRWIPVGGFVDLVGEHPEADEADDPRGLWRRPAWQKIIVFSAGVVMNAALALVLFALAPIVGIQAPVPIVGGVAPGMPAEKAGVLPGDRIVAIDGRPINSFEELIWTVALSDAGTAFQMDLDRPASEDRPAERFSRSIISMRVPGSMAPMIGVEPEQEPVIARMRPDSIPKQAGLREGDRILAVNGRPVDSWRGLVKALADAPPRQCNLEIERDGRREDISVDFDNLKVFNFGLVPPCEITSVEPRSPAGEAGILTGDLVAAVGDAQWPTVKAVSDAIKAAGPGSAVRLVLQRGDKTVEVTCTPEVLPGADYPRLGVSLGPGFGPPTYIGEIEPKSPAAEAGLRPGDTVQAAGEPPADVNDWEDLSRFLITADGAAVPLRLKRGAETINAALKPRPVPQDHLSLLEAVGEPRYAPLPRVYNPVVAAERGVRQTLLWFGRIYINLKQLMIGQVSTKAAGGPVAIVQWSYNVAAHGMGALMDFLGMLTVSIAVLNFLPIPPFDGGHVLFVLIDKIKRRPVGLKARTVVWIIGWSLVGLIFVVVTYRDVMRWLSM